MTYNEWRDELKSNLLSASDGERRRVLDYYAEAYADRRDAGYTERQIIEDFGAPYDAAQRILLNICDEQDYVNNEDLSYKNPPKRVIQQENTTNSTQKGNISKENVQTKEKAQSKPIVKKMKAHPVLGVIICFLLAIPMFVVVMTLCGISLGFIITPFAFLAAGVASIGIGIVELFSNVLNGVYSIGEGIVSLGLCLVLLPLIIKFVKFLWKMLKKFIVWLGHIISGKETKV